MTGESKEQSWRGKEEATLDDIDTELGYEGILNRNQTSPVDVACRDTESNCRVTDSYSARLEFFAMSKSS